MYFNNEKENTNIDHQFKNNKKINFDFNKYKVPLIIGGGVLLLIILIIILISIFGNRSKYTIELSGNDIITVYQGFDFIDPGFIASDKQGNNVASDVKVDSNVDTSKIGEYKITYTLENITKIRYVNVVERPDSIINFYLKGGDSEATITLNVGDTYNEPGYAIIDSVDGDLSDKVEVTGSVDTTKAGTYTLTYTVINSAGVTMSKTRKVIVK